MRQAVPEVPRSRVLLPFATSDWLMATLAKFDNAVFAPVPEIVAHPGAVVRMPPVKTAEVTAWPALQATVDDCPGVAPTL